MNPLFPVLTGADYRRSLAWSRTQANPVQLSILRKLKSP